MFRFWSVSHALFALRGGYASAWCLLSACLILGCGGGESGPEKFPISGNVTLNGQPVPEGEIRFVPASGGAADAGPIANGAYNVRATAGPKKVEIYATRENPNERVPSAIDPEGTEPLREQYIPEKYNTSTELTADVSDSENNTKDFQLTE